MFSEEKYDLCVIGAGIAGISLAHNLIVKKNFRGKLIILEARNRIGGRIWTREIGGRKVEMGANWIHGVKGNPIYDLAISKQLITPDSVITDPLYNSVVRTTKGDAVNLDKFRKVYETYTFWLSEAEKLYKLSSSRSSTMPKSTISAKSTTSAKSTISAKSSPSRENPPTKFASVGEYLDGKIKDYLKTFKEPEKSVTQAILTSLLNRETIISGCDSMNECSLKYFGAYKSLPGGDCTLVNGYDQVVKALLDEICQKDVDKKFTLRLNTQVTKIHWSENSIDVLSLSGTRLKCNQCAITLPLGVLKKYHHVFFDPPLPRQKLESITKLGFGTVDKILLEYENSIAELFPFREMYLVWLPDEKSKSGWAGKIYSFTKVNDKVLRAWLSGKEAVAVEKLPAKEIMKICTNYLRKFLKNKKFPEPKNIHNNLWSNDPYSLGSYSFISKESSDADIIALSEPVMMTNEIKLIFAGEACHASFYSTVHGAYLSGETAAGLVKLVEKDCDSAETIFKSEFDGKLDMIP